MNFIHSKKISFSVAITLALFFFAGVVANAIAHEDEDVNPQVNGPVVREYPPEPKGLSKIQQARIINLSANISNRQDAVIERLSTIINRIEARMRIMESEGYNTDEAKTHIAHAQDALAHAQELISSIDTRIRDVTTSETPQGRWGEVRKIFIDTHAHIVETKQSLRDAIGALKNATKVEPVAPPVAQDEVGDVTDPVSE